MTVYDLASLYINDGEEMEIYDCQKEETVFRGSFNEVIYSDFSEREVGSFGIERGIIVINVD